MGKDTHFVTKSHFSFKFSKLRGLFVIFLLIFPILLLEFLPKYLHPLGT